MAEQTTLVLCILDGWGYSDKLEGNAIMQAKTPNWDMLTSKYPCSLIEASAENVGLPAGQMGNSEVGHMNIGAGRVILQDLPRIDATISSGELASNSRLAAYISSLQKSGGACHLLGLLSPGGVHSHQNHILALARIISDAEIPVRIHAFLDGRDTPPNSALQFMQDFIGNLPEHADIKIATISGRYYSMDRDKRWDRIQKSYSAIVAAEAEISPSALSAIEEAYDNGESDEFITPKIIGDYNGVKSGDGLLMANFRADRAREILHSLIDDEFAEFSRPNRPKFADILGMVQYSAALDRKMSAIFPQQIINNTLGEVVAKAGLKQLRIAETEKYAHVTFFLNGGTEQQYMGEERILVPSPKVATYDMQPEMSAYEVTDHLVQAIASEEYGFIVVNYANTDMVGHSGNLAAAIKAVEAVDNCLGRLYSAIIASGATLLITADHGNAEQMLDEHARPHTAHSSNRVPLILAGSAYNRSTHKLCNGILADIAPTCLALLGLQQPSEMTGVSLIE